MDSKDAVVLVMNNEPRLHGVGELFVLQPGLNEVPAKAWAEAMKVELFRFHVDMEHISVIQTAGKPVVLADHPIKAAVDLVKKTLNMERLVAWKSAEKRATVLGAIESQILLISRPAPKADAEDDDTE